MYELRGCHFADFHPPSGYMLSAHSLSPRGDYVISHLELTSQPSLILTILGSHESPDTLLFAAKETSRRLRIAFKYEYIHGDLEDSLMLCQFV